LDNTILTIFQGRAGDHNDLAIQGAAAVAASLSRQLGLTPQVIGTPQPALNTHWRPELDAAMPVLQALSTRLSSIFEQGARPLTVLTVAPFPWQPCLLLPADGLMLALYGLMPMRT
jgi:arginase